MRVLIGCESSGTAREAFRRLGHDAISCDLLPCDDGSCNHIQGDVLGAIKSRQWDMMIAFPPCTDLASSGARWFPEKRADGRQKKSIEFFMQLATVEIPMIAIENPIGIMSTKWRKPDCIVQPWQHGHGESKATCLWLHNLPVLRPTNIVEGREQRIWKMGPSADRWKRRSKTYQGIADAMANQWGKLTEQIGGAE